MSTIIKLAARCLPRSIDHLSRTARLSRVSIVIPNYLFRKMSYEIAERGASNSTDYKVYFSKSSFYVTNKEVLLTELKGQISIDKYWNSIRSCINIRGS